MIIRREALKAALVATTTEASRYYLHAVQVHPDGTIEATDGHMLVRVKDKYPQPDADFPVVPGGGEVDGVATAPILIPADLAVRLIAATPKKPYASILTSIQVGIRDGKRIALATDLQVPCVVDLENCNTEQKFPTTDRVMVKEGDRQKVIKLTLSAEMLINLAKIATTIGRAKGANAICFEIPTEGKYQGTTRADATGAQLGPERPDGQINSAVRVTMSGEDCSVEGVVMPCRM